MAQKKVRNVDLNQKRVWVDYGHEELPINHQCELLNLSRASLYYREKGESEFNLKLMQLIDKQYIKTPFYGIRRMTSYLKREGYKINHKRIARLMRLMGIQALYPKKRLSVGNKSHKIYPYLLRGLSINNADQVWCTDITYIPIEKGFFYLVAIIDWFSRYILSWEISLTLEKEFCIEALERALRIGKPDIFNSDQGSQFTSPAYTSKLEEAEVRISMDGRGRVFDNIFIERFWRSLKWEEVYLREYRTVIEAVEGIKKYIKFYNEERLHQSLGYKTPYEIYWDNRYENEGRKKNA